MIDKTDVIIARHASFGKKFVEVECELRRNPQFGPFKPSKHYRAVADLRPFGWDAIMHLEQKRYGTHKIELLDTGAKTMDQLCCTVEELVDADPMSHRIGRIDLAADVVGVPLTWFRDHVRIQFKQWLCAHGKLEVEFSEMGKKVYQTLYFGKRPACFRIYDKVAERRCEYEHWKKREIRKAKQAALEECFASNSMKPVLLPEFPSFEEWLAIDLAYSTPPQSELPGMEQPCQLSFPVITRVENQLGGRVPRKLNTLAAVVQNVYEFNPFERVQIANGNRTAPDFYDRNEDGSWRYGVMQCMAGKWLGEHWNEIGAAEISTLLNRDRNGKKVLESLRDFVPIDDGPGVTQAELYERYQASVSRQLAA